MRANMYRAPGGSRAVLRDPLLLAVLVLCSAGTLAVAVVMANGNSRTNATASMSGETVVTAGPTLTTPHATQPVPSVGKNVITPHRITPHRITPNHVMPKPPPAVPVPTITHVVPGSKSSSLVWTSTATTGSAAVIRYNVYLGTHPSAESTTPINGKTPVTTTSYVVQGLTTGVTYYFIVKAVFRGRLSSASNEVSAVPGSNYVPVGTLSTPVVSIAAMPDGGGYWLANYQGAISAHGLAVSKGSTAGTAISASICQIVATSDGKGYWEVARDGGVFAFGDAQYFGSAAGLKLKAPIVGLAATRDDKGYWEVARDGGVFAFGDAKYFGSMAGKPVIRRFSAIAADPTTGGYWEMSLDGGIFAFNAPFLGTAHGQIGVGSAVGIAVTATGRGYWVVANYGGVFAFGDAKFHGSFSGAHLNAPVAGIASDPSTGGYWLVSSDGGVFAFGAPDDGGG